MCNKHMEKKTTEVLKEKTKEYKSEEIGRGLAYLFLDKKVEIEEEHLAEFLEELGVVVIPKK